MVVLGPPEQLLSHSPAGHGRGGLRAGAAEAAAELLRAPGLPVQQGAAPSAPALPEQTAERPPEQPGPAGPAPAHPRPGRTQPRAPCATPGCPHGPLTQPGCAPLPGGDPEAGRGPEAAGRAGEAAAAVAGVEQEAARWWQGPGATGGRSRAGGSPGWPGCPQGDRGVPRASPPVSPRRRWSRAR